MQEGISKLGITGLILAFFKDRIATWADIAEWIALKKRNPSSDPIPEKFKRGIMILPDSACIYQNFNENQKNRITLNICNRNTESIDDMAVLCLADKSLDESIDFAQDSEVIAIGRPWLPEPKEDAELNLILMTCGMFAYPDGKIPRVSTEQLNESKTLQEKPKEAKIVTATEDDEEESEDAEGW